MTSNDTPRTPGDDETAATTPVEAQPDDAPAQPEDQDDTLVLPATEAADDDATQPLDGDAQRDGDTRPLEGTVPLLADGPRPLDDGKRPVVEDARPLEDATRPLPAHEGTGPAAAPVPAPADGAAPGAPAEHRPSLRVGTVVWGLVLAAIGVGVIAWAGGASIDLQLATIVLLAAAGVALLVGSLVSGDRRSRR